MLNALKFFESKRVVQTYNTNLDHYRLAEGFFDAGDYWKCVIECINGLNPATLSQYSRQSTTSGMAKAEDLAAQIQKEVMEAFQSNPGGGDVDYQKLATQIQEQATAAAAKAAADASAGAGASAGDYFDYASVPKKLTLAHGSIVVEVEWDDTKGLTIEAPFVKLGDSKRVPLLRQVTQINGDLMLPRIVLRDNELYYHYSGQPKESHPAKIYGVFRETCYSADEHDDIFIQRFGAERVRDMDVIEVDAATKEQIWDEYQESIGEVLDLYEHFKAKDQQATLFYLVLTGVYRLNYIFDVQGYIGSDFFQKQSNAGHDRPRTVKLMHRFLTEMKNMDKNKFFEDVYSIKRITPERGTWSLPQIQNFVNDYVGGVEGSFHDGAYEYTVLLGLECIYYLNFRTELGSQLHGLIVGAAQSASEQPLKDAAQIILRSLSAVTNLPTH